MVRQIQLIPPLIVAQALYQHRSYLHPAPGAVEHQHAFPEQDNKVRRRSGRGNGRSAVLFVLPRKMASAEPQDTEIPLVM